MSTFSLIIMVIKLLNFIANRIQLSEARKQIMAEEILKLEQSLKITRKIVKEADALTEEQVNDALRG
jgi:hypothetical protein